MIVWWILYGAGVIAGIVIPVVVKIRERRVYESDVRTGLRRMDRMSLADLGMLSGGPGRMVDTILTDLVERGHVVADGGALRPPSDGETGAGVPLIEVPVIDGVTKLGTYGVTAVRRHAGETEFLFQGVFATLVQDRFLVSPQRRIWEPAGLAIAVLVLLALAMFGMMASLPESEPSVVVAGTAWVPAALLTGFLMSRRPGFSGSDPRSVVTLACVADALAALPDDTPQARRVALGGFAAMTDPALRKTIQGEDPDSAWQAPWRRSQAGGIELVTINLVRPPRRTY